MKRHIPNIITACNLLAGAIAVVFALQGQYEISFGLIILGAIFDFFDGMSARALKVSNPLGKELDSLADDITFGLAPTLMLFSLLQKAIGWWALLVLPMAAFSALRLAKFNLDERQTTSFIGLATPANAIFWASLTSWLSTITALPIWLIRGLILLSYFSCYLLVSELPLFSLKFHNFSWTDNKVKYIFLIGASVLLITCIAIALAIDWCILWLAGAMVIVWYVLLALITQEK